MKIKTIIIILILSASVFTLTAQSNEVLDRYLDQDKADLATSVWLVYLSAQTLPGDATPEDAMEYLRSSKHGRRFESRAVDSPIEFREYALIAMSEHKLPGGLMYSIFRSPRFAAKEMLWRRWIPGDPDPGTDLTPWDVTTSLSQLISWKEEQNK